MSKRDELDIDPTDPDEQATGGAASPQETGRRSLRYRWWRKLGRRSHAFRGR